MTSSQDLFRFLVGILMSLSLMFLDTVGGTRWLRGGVELVMKPELRGIATVGRGIDAVVSAGRFSISGRSELLALQRELSITRHKLLEKEDVKQENEDLKKVLGAVTFPQPFHFAPARVLSRGSMLIVENTNFSPGQVVVTPEGVLVGTIQDVGMWNARVQLVTNAQWSAGVSVVLPDGSDTDGDMHGVFGTSMIVEKISAQVQLSQGLLVVTRGDDDTMPARILIGKIGSHIHDEESAVYQSADIDPLIDIPSLSTVMVLEKNPI